MISSGLTLKEIYPRLFHVTCISHVLHNCAEKIRSRYKNIDFLISSIKLATVKNRDRHKIFDAVGMPPQPVITRWGSWLKAAFYYSEKLPDIKKIVNSFKGKGILVFKAKESLLDKNLYTDLGKLKNNYADLLDLINKTEKNPFNIKNAFDELSKLNFGDDIYLTNYFKKKITKKF